MSYTTDPRIPFAAEGTLAFLATQRYCPEGLRLRRALWTVFTDSDSSTLNKGTPDGHYRRLSMPHRSLSDFNGAHHHAGVLVSALSISRLGQWHGQYVFPQRGGQGPRASSA